VGRGTHIDALASEYHLVLDSIMLDGYFSGGGGCDLFNLYN